MGLSDAGMKVLAGIDIDTDSGRTYKLNFPKASFLKKDIRSMKTSDLESYVPLHRDFPLLFSTCAPCQPFTKQKTKKRLRDARKALLDNLHRFIRHYHPEYVLLENVPGLQKLNRIRGPLPRFLTLLRSQGYDFSACIMNSQEYGVPQHRKRFILLASSLGPIDFPPITHGPDLEWEYANVWAWIGDLPPIAAGERHAEVPNHHTAQLSNLNLTRITSTPEGGGRRDWPKSLTLTCHKSYNGHTDVYGRMWKNKPATALTTKCISLSNGRYGHPTQNRAISAREAARLQTFPDDFVFEGSLTSSARQIGNAVPVLLAKKLGQHIVGHYQQLKRVGAP